MALALDGGYKGDYTGDELARFWADAQWHANGGEGKRPEGYGYQMDAGPLAIGALEGYLSGAGVFGHHDIPAAIDRAITQWQAGQNPHQR